MKYVSITIRVVIAAILLFYAYSCLFSPKITSAAFLKKYSGPEITYFQETAFERKKSIIKWEDKIRITLMGNYSVQDSLEAVRIVKEVAPLVNVEMELLPGNVKEGNLQIYLLKSDAEDEAAVSKNDLAKAMAKTEYRFAMLSNRIIGAKIFVFHFAGSKYWTLRHEFCHALGLSGHSKQMIKQPRLLGPELFDSIEESETWVAKEHTFPEPDKRSIQLLYEKDLPIGLKNKDFYKRF